MSRLSAARRALFAIAATLACASNVAAQDRLSVGGWEVVSSGPDFGATVGPAGALAGMLAAGGRYGLLSDRLRDRVTGAEIEFWNAMLLQTIATDPARPRAFFARHPNRFAPANAVVMADLRTGAITPLLSLPGLAGGLATAQFAVDVERLVVSYPDASGLPVLWAVVDVAGPMPVIRTLSTPPEIFFGPTMWALSPDGTRLYRPEQDQTSGTAALVAYDLDTSSEVGRVAMPTTTSRTLEWHDALDGLVDARSLGSNVVFTLFSRDLQPIAGASVPVTNPCSGAQVVVSPSSGRLFTFTGGGNYFGSPLPSLLTAVALGTSGPIDAVDVAPEAKGNCGGMRLASPPGAPRRLRATVAGATVAFAWENVGAASQFTVDVGLAAGRTDVSIPLGPDSHWTITGVPRGAYYVRVRGTNTFGGGRPSAEIQVVVP